MARCGAAALFALAALLAACGVGAERTLSRFAYPNFEQMTGLQLVNAYRDGNVLVLSGANQRRSGALWRQLPASLNTSWSTTFSFKMVSSGVHGLAFVMQAASPTVIGFEGTELGYGGLPKSVAIEFDTHQDGAADDAGVQHIAIHRNPTAGGPNSMNSSFAVFSYVWDAHDNSLNSGSTFTVQVSYTLAGSGGGAPSLQLSVDGQPLTGPSGVALDLAAAIGSSTVFLGFTAATGEPAQEHVLRAWSFATNATAPCDSGFVFSQCVPDVTQSNCGDSESCGDCMANPFPCEWDDGCILRSTHNGGVTSFIDCPSPTSYVWLWILLAITGVVIGTGLVLYYLRRKAQAESVEAQYGYM